jgi:hypothetical protein
MLTLEARRKRREINGAAPASKLTFAKGTGLAIGISCCQNRGFEHFPAKLCQAASNVGGAWDLGGMLMDVSPKKLGDPAEKNLAL